MNGRRHTPIAARDRHALLDNSSQPARHRRHVIAVRVLMAVSLVAMLMWSAGRADAYSPPPCGPDAQSASVCPFGANPDQGYPPLMNRVGLGSATAVPCGWMFDVSAKTLNIAAPDTHTNYFVQPYYLGAGQQIVLNGVYPYSRYFSFVAYGSDGSPINNASIYDKHVVPDTGSVNPFTTVNPPTDANQRRYTIRITASQPAAGTPNTIPGLSAQDSQGFGFLVYRIYLANDAKDPAAGVPLPTITTASGTHRTCSRGERAVFNRLCAPFADALVAKSAPDPSTVVRGASLFRRAGDLGGLFPNPDNQYVFQASDWSPGTVIVIRGKAMTFPDTRHGGSTTTRTDVRYWSMCSNELANPYPAISCASDDETAVDSNGYYTYVDRCPRIGPATPPPPTASPGWRGPRTASTRCRPTRPTCAQCCPTPASSTRFRRCRCRL